jgi:ectoine hydroxylase-related dioxygenase (phytanoyl-CoA dioxygenase family)
MILRDFRVNGFVIIPQVFSSLECDRIADKLNYLGKDLAGTRNLISQTWCQELAISILQNQILSTLIASDLVAVQCSYFQKSPTRNWLVPLHQDLSIPVAKRVEDPILSGWSEKEGTLYVQPPVEFLEQLTAVRLHIDRCEINDGPLRLVPGTHLSGKLDRVETLNLSQKNHEIDCLADKGDVLVIQPLLLHSSSKSRGNGLRRVLHFLFAPRDLPCGLEWQ